MESLVKNGARQQKLWVKVAFVEHKWCWCSPSMWEHRTKTSKTCFKRIAHALWAFACKESAYRRCIERKCATTAIAREIFLASFELKLSSVCAPHLPESNCEDRSWNEHVLGELGAKKWLGFGNHPGWQTFLAFLLVGVFKMHLEGPNKPRLQIFS